MKAGGGIPSILYKTCLDYAAHLLNEQSEGILYFQQQQQRGGDEGRP